VDDLQIKELMDKIDLLIKALKDQGKFNYVNIEHADIQGPLVDKLNYNFDKLDVKEVSGALNLGTTFGVKVAEKRKKSGSGGGSSSTTQQSKQQRSASTATQKNGGSQQQSFSQSSRRTDQETQIPTQNGESPRQEIITKPLSKGSGSSVSKGKPQNHDKSYRKKDLNPLSQTVITERTETEIPKKSNPPSRMENIRVQKQPAPIQKKKPDVKDQQEKENTNQGRFKFSFRRREKANKANTTVAEAPEQMINKEPVTTHKSNPNIKNKGNKGTKPSKSHQKLDDLKTANPFSSTKKGFTIKLN
jgi:hypothetical protein